MRSRKTRPLRKDELELWRKVVEHAVPLHPEPPRPSPTPKYPASTPVAVRSGPEFPRFRIGETAAPSHPAHDLMPTIQEQIGQLPVRMDRKQFGKLKKGRLAPEARIDLHGLTLAQAHPMLIRFILEAVADGQRLVLVITGKGRQRSDAAPMPERQGILRHQVPHWLNTAPLRQHVLQIAEAHVKHGGAGAYYVYLRRPRQ